MKKIFCLASALLTVTMFVGCPSGGGGGENEAEKADSSANISGAPSAYEIKGSAQKGPFVLGADISLFELNDQLVQTGKTFSTKTTDHSGSFSISIENSNPLLEVVGNGFYFDEVKGELSSAPMTLRALVDLRSGTTVNLNVLTSLSVGRIRQLVSGGTPFATASNQAASETLAAFGIPDNESFRNFSNMNLATDGDANAILLAI